MKVFVIILSVFALTLGNIIPRISDRIYGGHATTIEKYPHQVSLVYFDENNNFEFCGGSIVNKDTIVTAAHCVHGQRILDNFTVIAGSTYLNAGEQYKIVKIIVHPEFSLAKMDNDIAVVKLATPLTFSDKVQPIVLQPADSLVAEGTTAQATGWGGTMIISIGLAPQLQEVDLNVISNENCQYFSNIAITSSMLCTRLPGKGTYRGDSGGPLVFNNTLIGVSSWVSSFSTGFPDVFARVSFLNGFITKNM